jgi:hypothetical protein
MPSRSRRYAGILTALLPSAVLRSFGIYPEMKRWIDPIPFTRDMVALEKAAATSRQVATAQEWALSGGNTQDSARRLSGATWAGDTMLACCQEADSYFRPHRRILGRYLSDLHKIVHASAWSA